ncbi:MAG: OmpA family protein [Pseudomonadota bacterium]|nr:OmpA family protein [Pseudomonadota bacterium]
MKLSTALGMLGVMSFPAIASSIASAADSGWYVGGNAGQSRAKIDNTRIAGGLTGQGIATTSIRDDDRHFAYKLFGGYDFNKYFALEAGYFDLGRFGFTANTVPAAGLTGKTKMNGANFDVVGTLPLADKFSAFARVGYTYSYAKDEFAGYGAVIVRDRERNQHASNYKFGVGLQYAVTESFGLRAEAERYRVNDAVGNKGDIDLVSAGAVYRFGRAPPAAPAAAPVAVVAAEPVVAPAPAPVEPAPPPPPPRRNVSFAADSLFEFGKDTINPRGKQALQDFAMELQGTRFEVITVTGYSDRIGSHAYNMKLSTRRAEAVKSYLADRGIAYDKIMAKGADGSDPVTKPGQCPGERRTAELIACLQPDRRVEVEVVGTQAQGRH